ncbi:hypothetical protein A9D14_17500 (plasmid) [Croceicoccus marinus]|uniref:Uncharacterized protein n=1 Tax=Croceicoccus marinus TaxID=450378 RepID=A0A1Z1FH92_9SPHN|nr:hypothetical protein A9D14_17500 [Croceicoccus marinus]
MHVDKRKSFEQCFLVLVKQIWILIGKANLVKRATARSVYEGVLHWECRDVAFRWKTIGQRV